MFKLLYRAGTSSELLTYWALCWWIFWSNLYQAFERKCLGTCVVPQYRAADYGDDIIEAWDKFVNEYKIEYAPDTWYMLFDAMSSPERVFYRRRGDCEDYASLVQKFFGNYFLLNDQVYYFDHFECQIGAEEAHTICVYKAPNGDVVEFSNGKAYLGYYALQGMRHIAEVVYNKKGKLSMRNFMSR